MTTTNNAPISFRLTDDELELLRQCQEDGEKSLNLTAKRLLLNALGVDAKKPSLQVVNTVDMVQVQELIEAAVQEQLTELTTVDIVDTIKNLIAESLADGDIKDAIANSYADAMGQFNGLLEELQDLKSQIQELKSVPAALVPQSQIEELTTDNEELTTDNEQLSDELADLEQLILDLVPFDRLIEACDVSPLDGKDCGEIYNKEALKQNGIFASLKTHQFEIEKILNIKLSLDNDNYAVREMNKILKALGYEINKKQINKVEHYWVINPQK